MTTGGFRMKSILILSLYSLLIISCGGTSNLSNTSAPKKDGPSDEDGGRKYSFKLIWICKGQATYHIDLDQKTIRGTQKEWVTLSKNGRGLSCLAYDEEKVLTIPDEVPIAESHQQKVAEVIHSLSFKKHEKPEGEQDCRTLNKTPFTWAPQEVTLGEETVTYSTQPRACLELGVPDQGLLLSTLKAAFEASL